MDQKIVRWAIIGLLGVIQILEEITKEGLCETDYNQLARLHQRLTDMLQRQDWIRGNKNG